MMKNYFIALVALCIGLTSPSQAQSTTIATYTTGHISSDFFTGSVPITQNSTCPATLTVPVPAGRFVTSVDVEYDFEALGFTWQREQSSYLECVTTNIKEASVSLGPNVSASGTVAYNRTGLTIANGVVPSGGLQFKLHAFRSFSASGCNTTTQRVVNNTFKITVTHVAAPTCLPPTALSLNTVTATTANIGWTTGGATNWQIEYGPAGFTPGTGTRVAALTNPFTITGLSPSTRYDFVVRDSCSATDVSFWSLPFSFRSSCSVINAPWTENFSGADWIPGTAFGVNGSIDTCFSRNHQNNFVLKAGPPAFPAFNSGPSGDHTTGSGKYIYSERLFFGAFPSTATINTPPINVSVLTSPELTFWYHMFGPDVHRLRALVSTDGGVNFTSVFSITGQQQFAKTDPWLEAIVNLSAYSNDTIILRFEVLQNTTGVAGDVAIDDISIHEAPTCKRPTNLNFIASSSSSITIGWTSGGASNWQIEYGSVGFTPGTGTIVNAASNPFTISGLSANTDYDFYVRDSCSATDKSLWSIALKGKTTCAPAVAPYFENFDGIVWNKGAVGNTPGTINTCWNRDEMFYIFKSGPPTFVSTQTGSQFDHTQGNSSGKYLQTERILFSTLLDTATITSVPIDLSPLTVPEMSFWYHMFGGDIDKLIVSVSNNNGASYSQVLLLSGQLQNSNVAAWKESVVNLSAYANDTVIIRFQATHLNFGAASDLGIDDLDIHEQPTCPKPQTLALVGQTNSTVTLQWTTGGAANWNVEYGPVGFTPGTGTRVNTAVNPFTVTGLSANTTYQFYVRDSCGLADVSDWIGPIRAKTDCNPISAPYTENFDGASWTIGTFTIPGNLDACWYRDSTLNYQLTPMSTIPTFSTGPVSDHTSGSGKFLAAQRFFGSHAQSRIAVVESPLIDLTALTTPELAFWYHMFGIDIDSLQLEIFDGNSWNREASIIGQQQTSKNAGWEELVVDIGAYANDTIKVRFTAYRSTVFAFNSAVAIDDLDIHEKPTCPKTQNLVLLGQTNSTATLQWTSGGATNWNVEYGPVGFTPGAGTRVNAAVNPFTVTGLSANTNYQFYVRDSCGLADVSDWVGPVKTKTDCNPVTAPYTENFDGAAWTIGTVTVPGNLDPCWYRDSTLNYQMTPMSTTTAFSTGPTSDHTTGSGKFLVGQRFFGSLAQSRTAVVESPLIDLTALTIPELTFWYHMFGVDIDSLQVEIFDGSSWSREASLAGQQQTSKGAVWQELLVDISSYANDTIKVRFTAYRSTVFAFNSALAIDDVDIHEQPTCPQPSNLSVTSTNANSVTLSWTTGGATNWQIEYGPSGYTAGAGTIVNASTNPFIITGLNSSSSYDFFVRDSCGVADVSFWVGRATGTTSCLPLLAPFNETFDGPSWVVGSNFNDTGSIAQCWVRTPLANYLWKPGPPIFGSNFTGPSGDHTSGNGKYLFAESIFGGGTAPFDGFVETPLIDLSALTVPELSFWYHMFGNNIGSMAVEVDNGGGYTQIWSKTGQQQNAGTDPWKEAVISLSAYANDTIRLRFKATKATFGTQADAAIDDIDIHESPSCPKPQNLAIVGKTNSTITLSWTTGGATNWNIEYGSPGFTIGTGTLVNTSTNPFTITGLSANTGYEFYVRDSCGLADVSDWIGAVGDTTDCNPIAAPYTENFDGGVWTIGAFGTAGNLDACWNRDETVNYVWAPQNTTTPFTTGPTADHTSGTGKFIHTQRTFGTVIQSMEGEVISPLIDLSPLTTPEMSFWYHMFGAEIDSLAVQIFDGNSWKHELSIVGPQQTSKTDLWKEAIVDISSYANDTIKVRFIGYRNSTFAFNSLIAIDDLDIHEQPACPKPSALSITSTSSNSATLAWTSGGASNWQIEYGTAGFTLGSGTIVNAPTNPFVVTGLSSSTTYDFYVRDSCSATDLSDWYGVATGATDCLPVLAPFTENFDGPTWTAGPNFNDTGTVAQCWIRTPLANYLWKTGPPAFISNVTGPAVDHTTGTGKFIYAESIFGGGTAPFDALIESPLIDLSSLTAPELRFWYHMFGTAIGTMTVEIDNGSGYTQIWTKTGQQQVSGTDAWKEAIVSLSSYVNDTIQIRIKATKASFSTLADAAVDDISVKEAPACPRPVNISQTTSTTTSITLSWTTGGATNWLIGYRGAGATGPLTIVAANTNPFTITGLTPSASYDFYVKDSCALGDVSLWEGPFGAGTQCGIAVAPWSESFDGSSWVEGTGFQNVGNIINSCWSRPSVNNPNFGSKLGGTTSGGTGPSADVSGNGKYIYTEASGAVGTGEITTPYIYVPNSLQNPRFKFAYHMFGNSITSLAVKIDNGSGFGANVKTITGAQQTSNTAAWRFDSISLNTYKGDTIRIRFLGTNSGFNGDIAVDEVSVIADPGSPTCSDPTNLTIASVTPVGFTINWIGNGNSQVEVVLSGQPQGSGTTYYNVSSPLAVTGLSSNTAYDVYVRDSCGITLYSQWINASKTTLVCPPITAGFSSTNSWLGVNFNSGATVNADSLQWNFGDGNGNSATNPAHTYAAAGTYIVTMDAFSDCGSTAQFVDTIRVCDTLSADFTFTAKGDTVSFDASASSNATSYSWDLNGFAMTGQMINYKFPSPGTKSVTLTVYNACGDSVKISKNVKVCLPPKANWTYNIISTTSSGMNTQFDASASQNAITYEWDFGDGSPLVTGQVMPQHTFLTPGLFYKVTLKVTNTCGDLSVMSFKLNEIGVEEFDLQASFMLYPNPAKNAVTVEWDATSVKALDMEIVDATGKLILNPAVNKGAQGKQTINVSSLAEGYYMIRIVTSKGIIQRKLIIR